ncbi:helix-turn-helix domain-containing protein [Paenibacillus oleatilyticus]|uniref:helix-turn-helix domain-containing protein n=1 Tax=Paenibacillus oleatilyticus TaxID=2594886 RepID=UPI001C1FA3E9|nr:helix-turn-helix transcriptional regulator [Paenibacillus oleatilyticus]MBU7319526.1 helix-turn-helix domain-containing protein [Paenibacillus oleatilyticus]
MKLAEHVGAKIRIFRKNRGLTQEKMGEMAEIPQSYIGGIERGEKNVSLDTIERIAAALDIDPSELFKSYYKSTKDQLEKDKILDSISISLSNRTITEIEVIKRLVLDVIRVFDTK